MAFSQRENCHWFELELKTRFVENQWQNEKAAHAKLIVSGPMVDCYIKEFASQMMSRLSRGKHTGIMSISQTLIPRQVMVQIIRLIKQYGGHVTSIATKKRRKNNHHHYQ